MPHKNESPKKVSEELKLPEKAKPLREADFRAKQKRKKNA